MIALNTEEKLEEALKESETGPVLIYKHSNTCHISGAAEERLKEGISDGRLKIPLYILTVQDSRDLSNKLALDFDIKHESPQVILVQNGKAIYNESHYRVDADLILEAINS